MSIRPSHLFNKQNIFQNVPGCRSATQITPVKDQINFLYVNIPWLNFTVTIETIALGMKVSIILCGHGLDEMQMELEKPRKPRAALEMDTVASTITQGVRIRQVHVAHL